MTKEELRKRIAELMVRSDRAAQLPSAYGFLPAIVRSLEAMQNSLDLSRDRRARMAGALARLVTDGATFCDTELGTDLLDLANDFAELQ